MSIKNSIKNICRPIYGPIFNQLRHQKKENRIKAEIRRIKETLDSQPKGKKRVFYLGITSHSNLGDMAQYFCIHNWIIKNYPDHLLVEIEANTVVHEKHELIRILSNNLTTDDIIIFQSGYTTQDLGGVHDQMHREIISAMPDARILMMPQTIFFKNPENEKKSAKIYNSAKNMLFLARDQVSYEKALEMMPDINVMVYPDIVTSLIGKYHFSNDRKGICLCRRNDGEKYYSDEELDVLINKLGNTSKVTVCDTTIKVPFEKLRANRQMYIERQIEDFSKYEVVITDRYHGTIFSLVAGTPVIIIKTNDHKVITGADWFKGIYDTHVYLAEDLEDAYRIALKILNQRQSDKLDPYFEQRYYEPLKSAFEGK